MLNASELNAVIKGGVGDGVQLVLLLDANGDAMSSAFTDIRKDKNDDYAEMVAATANAWRVYARSDLAVNRLTLQVEPDSLEQVLVDFGEKKMCAMSVAGSAVLCLVSSDASVQMGLLKLKTAALQRKLDAMLRPVMSE